MERLENVDEMEDPGQEEPWDKEDLQGQEEIPGKEVTQDFQEMMAKQEHQEHQYVFRGIIFGPVFFYCTELLIFYGHHLLL